MSNVSNILFLTELQLSAFMQLAFQQKCNINYSEYPSELYNYCILIQQWSSNIKIYHYTEATFNLLNPTVVAQSSSCEN